MHDFLKKRVNSRPLQVTGNRSPVKLNLYPIIYAPRVIPNDLYRAVAFSGAQGEVYIRETEFRGSEYRVAVHSFFE